MPLLAALTLAGAVLRFATLDVQGLWYDEAVTALLVRDDLGGMLHRIPDSESTPPLYYLLAWLWTKPFGTGEVGLRSLSALLGTGAIPACWVAARELTRSDPVALAVAALAAFSPILVWYSQEARAYALLLVFAALGLLFFARALRGEDWRPPAAWGLFSALALATHYFAAFLILPQAVWLLTRAPEARCPRRDRRGDAHAGGARPPRPAPALAGPGLLHTLRAAALPRRADDEAVRDRLRRRRSCCSRWSGGSSCSRAPWSLSGAALPARSRPPCSAVPRSWCRPCSRASGSTTSTPATC